MEALQLRFSNNLVFTAVMQDRPDLCKRLIERILDMEIDEIVDVRAEDTLVSAGGKSVRLDVTVITQGRIIDIEMQCTDSRHLGRRMRFYQAKLDSRVLKRGSKYSAMPECYVIFICTFDHFDLGLPVYWFEPRCRGAEADLGTGLNFVVVNAQAFEACDDAKLRNLLKYVQTNIPTEEDDLIMALSEEIEEQGRGIGTLVLLGGMDPEMDRAVAREEGYEDGLEQGLELGLEQGDDRRRSADISLVERFIASGGSMEELLAAMKAES